MSRPCETPNDALTRVIEDRRAVDAWVQRFGTGDSVPSPTRIFAAAGMFSEVAAVVGLSPGDLLRAMAEYMDGGQP